MRHSGYIQKRCGRCKMPTRTPLHPLMAGNNKLMEICGRCYKAVTTGGEPIFKKPESPPTKVVQ